eukprot:307939-Chlamydomonas_euryale.AAC.1
MPTGGVNEQRSVLLPRQRHGWPWAIFADPPANRPSVRLTDLSGLPTLPRHWCHVPLTRVPVGAVGVIMASASVAQPFKA